MYCIPSHSSHLFQVLDLMPNAQIKRYLQTVRPMKKNPNEEEMIRFIGEVETAVSKGLTKDVIQEGFF
jgi:hypothetical protein